MLMWAHRFTPLHLTSKKSEKIVTESQKVQYKQMIPKTWRDLESGYVAGDADVNFMDLWYP